MIRFVIFNCFQTYFPSTAISQIIPAPKLMLLVESLLLCQAGRILKQTMFLKHFKRILDTLRYMAMYYFSLP